jgi:hypothetical protein
MYNMSKTTKYGFQLVAGVTPNYCLAGRGLRSYPWIGTMFYTRFKSKKEVGIWPGTFLPHASGPLGLASEMFVFSYEALVRSANTASEIEALNWV